MSAESLDRYESRELESLRAAWRSLSEGASPATECPDADRIWAAAWGELTLSERHEVVDHLATCATCAEAWRLARALGEPSNAEPARDEERSRTAGPGWLRPALLAASTLLVAILGLQIVEWQRGPDDAEYRDGSGTAIVGLIDEETPQPRNELVLRWQAPAEAVAYDLRVTDASLAVVARARELSEPRFTVPAESLQGVSPGATLFWQVEAILADGSRLVSDTFVVRVDGAAP